MGRKRPIVPTTTAQRARLPSFQLEAFAAWLKEHENKLSTKNQAACLRVVRKLTDGVGVSHWQKPAPGFYAGRKLTLQQSARAVQQQAREWLPAHLDKGHGWALNHPLKYLSEYQEELCAKLKDVSVPVSPSLVEPPPPPAPAAAPAPPPPAPAPAARKHKRKRAVNAPSELQQLGRMVTNITKLIKALKTVPVGSPPHPHDFVRFPVDRQRFRNADRIKKEIHRILDTSKWGADYLRAVGLDPLSYTVDRVLSRNGIASGQNCVYNLVLMPSSPNASFGDRDDDNKRAFVGARAWRLAVAAQSFFRTENESAFDWKRFDTTALFQL